MHYRLRAIRGVPLGVVNFTSHFIVIQIFQILFLPPVSFYTHPNISDMFVGDEIYLFNLTFHEKLIINLKKGRDELVDICPLSTAKIVAIKYLLFQKSILTMKGASAEVAFLSFFIRHDPFFHHAKFQFPLRPPFTFLGVF